MIRVGEIDWVARFGEMARAAEESSGAKPADRWQDRAARFDRMSRADASAASSVEGLAPHVRAGDVVLDIGAGTGRHALPLASRGARVVALEPSPSMRARLVARLAEAKADRVSVLEHAWPFAGAPTVDVAVSAHVLYGVVDVAAFVGAMTACARRTCALLLKVRAPADALGDVYEAAHGVRRPRRPGALEALAVLHQLGLVAELAFDASSSRTMTFDDTPDDLREVALRLGLTPDEAGLARARDALERAATRVEGGFRVGESGPTACITWPGAAGG